MNQLRSAIRASVVPVADRDDVARDDETVRDCLRQIPPRLPAWFGYDAIGSELFEQITELPTYYLTRVEQTLLERNSAEIAEMLGCGQIAELGSGSAKKTRVLLERCVRLRDTTYLPIDVDRGMLHSSGAAGVLGADPPESHGPVGALRSRSRVAADPRQRTARGRVPW